MPLLETPGHFWASLGQSFAESLLLSLGSWCTDGSVCARQAFVSQSMYSPWGCKELDMTERLSLHYHSLIIGCSRLGLSTYISSPSVSPSLVFGLSHVIGFGQ